ncbi:hypothetical protein EDB84DRAFT_1446376 [Lactarius hengduanensis]|nr:hypothetical protein EDB84DRAFT_1446376 [Lactarius hengduanensis]
MQPSSLSSRREFEVDTKTQDALTVNTQVGSHLGAAVGVPGTYVRAMTRGHGATSESWRGGDTRRGRAQSPAVASVRAHTASTGAVLVRVVSAGGSGLPACDREKGNANASMLGAESACRRGGGGGTDQAMDEDQDDDEPGFAYESHDSAEHPPTDAPKIRGKILRMKTGKQFGHARHRSFLYASAGIKANNNGGPTPMLVCAESTE